MRALVNPFGFWCPCSGSPITTVGDDGEEPGEGRRETGKGRKNGGKTRFVFSLVFHFSFFLSEEHVTDDFMTERASQDQDEREAWLC